MTPTGKFILTACLCFVLFSVLAMGGCYYLLKTTAEEVRNEQRKQQEQQQPAAKQITWQDFQKIQPGMNYFQVVQLLGEGRLISESVFADSSAQVYSWDVGFLKSITCYFQNGKLITKSQVGLN